MIDTPTSKAIRQLTDAISVYVREEIDNVRRYDAVDSRLISVAIAMLVQAVQDETLEQVRRTLRTAGLLDLD